MEIKKTCVREDCLHSELTEKIIGTFYEVYNQLGFGFLESVYQKAMIIALDQRALRLKLKFLSKFGFGGRKSEAFTRTCLSKTQ
jgi:GxxExxY protein